MFTVPLGWKGLKSFRRLQAFIDCGLDRINEVVRGDRVFQPLRDIKTVSLSCSSNSGRIRSS